ncbi:hypothetical protein X975_23801, partial [Stegodyphus mimosarum]
SRIFYNRRWIGNGRLELNFQIHVDFAIIVAPSGSIERKESPHPLPWKTGLAAAATI